MSVTAARPVLERIGDALFQRVQMLAAGYSELFIASEVVRPTRMGGYTPKDRQIVIVTGDREEVPELNLPGNPPAQCFKQTFNIYCHAMPSEKDPTPVDVYLAVMQAEVQKVVTDSGTRWHNWNSLAINSEWLPSTPIEADGGVDGINQPLDVTYRTDEGNPYKVRA